MVDMNPSWHTGQMDKTNTKNNTKNIQFVQKMLYLAISFVLFSRIKDAYAY